MFDEFALLLAYIVPDSCLIFSLCSYSYNVFFSLDASEDVRVLEFDLERHLFDVFASPYITCYQSHDMHAGRFCPMINSCGHTLNGQKTQLQL